MWHRRGAACFRGAPDICSNKQKKALCVGKHMRACVCGMIMAAGIGRLLHADIREQPFCNGLSACRHLSNGASQKPCMYDKRRQPHVVPCASARLTLALFTSYRRRCLSLVHCLLAVLPCLFLPLCMHAPTCPLHVHSGPPESAASHTEPADKYSALAQQLSGTKRRTLDLPHMGAHG